MTTVPTWAAFAVTLGTPFVTLAGVLFAQWISRKGSQELETRSKREETMRNLRWAAELAVSSDAGKAALGLRQLTALGSSNLLNAREQLFIDAALAAVVKKPLNDIAEDERRGVRPVVVRAARRPAAPEPRDGRTIRPAAETEGGE